MYDFPKSERLHSKKCIAELFDKGSSITLYPIKVIYLVNPTDCLPINQVLVSAPKKFFKKAVDRNKIKRRIKEAYRLHKQILVNQQTGFHFHIGYIYVGKEIASYQTIEEKLKQSLLRLKDRISG